MTTRGSRRARSSSRRAARTVSRAGLCWAWPYNFTSVGVPWWPALIFRTQAYLKPCHGRDDLAAKGLQRRQVRDVGHVEDQMLEPERGQGASLRDHAVGCVASRHDPDGVERGALDRSVGPPDRLAVAAQHVEL